MSSEYHTKRFECACSLPEHSLRLDYDTNEEELYLYITKGELPFFKRLINGLRYIFGLEGRFYYDEVVLPKNKATQMVEYLNEFINNK